MLLTVHLCLLFCELDHKLLFMRFTNWGLIEFTNWGLIDYSYASISFSKAYEKGLMIAFIPFTSKALEPCQWEYTIKMRIDGFGGRSIFIVIQLMALEYCFLISELQEKKLLLLTNLRKKEHSMPWNFF
ncbi:hypothetical protein P8452_48940 [Trifolium repens]|nr:hypothetical protein P8452_48940 [Trifolium repens]